ncbi:MAG: ATP-binding protein [Candidatus Odinarchaeota archaeon]|nr:ATP-binding protein [Candidatus Odinarchaeota archaeon]
MDCLETGIFARTTLKPLKSIFNLEREKQVVKVLIESGEWFTVSGLRRTGKTTLTRSVANTLDVYPIYINLWKRGTELVSTDFILEEIVKEIQEISKRSKLKKILKYIEKISFLGVSVKLRLENQIRLTRALEELCKDKRVVLIFDEAEEMRHDTTIFKYLASLHDELSPRLSAIFLGSVVSMKSLLSSSTLAPLYGRLGEEIVLKPFNEIDSRKLLRKGFEECNTEVDEELIVEASLRLGGFAGWLTNFGRLTVLERRKGVKHPDLNKIIANLEEDTSKLIYEEIARILRGKKMISSYLKVIKFAAERGFITVSDASEILRKRASTAIVYLKQLVDYGIMTKSNSDYIILDPLVRRSALKPNFEKAVKIRL